MFLLYRLFLTTAHLLLMLSPLARVRICLQRMIKERLCGSPYSMQRWFGCVCLLLTAVTAPLIYYKPDSSIHYKTRVKPSACCAVFFLLQLPLVRLYNMCPMRLCVKLRSHCETLPSDTNLRNHERFILLYMVKSLKIVQ